MKQKGTKIYNSYVRHYCDARYLYESELEKIDKCNEKINKANKKFNLLDTCDEDIMLWYHTYIQIIETTLSYAETHAKQDKKTMEIIGETLENEYGENLNELYLNNKYFFS